jgi:hypothetical protein
MSSIPYYTLGGPGTPSTKITPGPDAPMISAYTGEQIGSGPIKYGTKSDAPWGHPMYGKPFHGGIKHPTGPGYMVHFYPHF